MFVTDEMEVSFLAVDSAGNQTTGPAQTWKNRVTLKYRTFTAAGGKKVLELKAAPNGDGKAEIRYTSDGSDPKLSGGVYDSPFAIPKGSPVVLAVASRDGVQSDLLSIPINWDKPDTEKPIDPEKPLVWRRKQDFRVTSESYRFMDMLKAHEARISGCRVQVTGDRWAELTMHETIELDAVNLYVGVEAVRKLFADGQLGIEASAIHFDRGQHFLDWLNEVKTEIKPGEVEQP
jgi:hypothetical protein